MLVNWLLSSDASCKDGTIFKSPFSNEVMLFCERKIRFKFCNGANQETDPKNNILQKLLVLLTYVHRPLLAMK